MSTNDSQCSDYIPLGLLYIRKDGLIVDCNEVLANWLQYGKEELIGRKKWVDVLSVGGKIYNQTHFMPLLSMGRWVEEVYFEFRKKDGQKLMVYINARELPEGVRTNGAQYCLSVFRSTQRARYEDEILKGKKQLEDSLHQLKATQDELIRSSKMALIGQMVGGVAHEINNPLNYISGGTGVLNEQLDFLFNVFDEIEKHVHSSELPEDALRAIRMHLQALEGHMDKAEMKTMQRSVREGVQRIVSIVNALRLCAPQHIGEKLLIQANIPLAAAWEVASGMASHLSATIGLEAEAVIHGVASELSQAFLNILKNAVESMPDGGSLLVQSQDVEGGVQIEIADTGPGIPEANMPKLFDPFFTTKAIGKGQGLGLSIARSIILKHKGHLDVQSVVGQGTRVLVFLPKAAEQHQ